MPTRVKIRYRDDENRKLLCKTCLLGDPAVGKTSLILRYVDNYFSTDYKKTIGSTFMVKRLKVKNVEVVLQIWDMAGDEYFRSMVPLLIKGASAIVLVYDLSRDATLANIPRWADLVVSSTRKTMPLVLIGNKQDLIRTKQFEQAQFLDNIQKKYKFSGIFQTSAKTSEGVEDTFKKLAENIVKWELKV